MNQSGVGGELGKEGSTGAWLRGGILSGERGKALVITLNLERSWEGAVVDDVDDTADKERKVWGRQLLNWKGADGRGDGGRWKWDTELQVN